MKLRGFATPMADHSDRPIIGNHHHPLSNKQWDYGNEYLKGCSFGERRSFLSDLCAFCYFNLENNKIGETMLHYLEPFSSTAKFNNLSTKTQMGVALNDTEVLHDLDLVEKLETQLLDECDIEVVPDSDDDEAIHAGEGKGFTRRSGWLIDNASPSFLPCRQLRHPVVNSDACADEGHVSGQSTDAIVCKGNDDRHDTVHSELQEMPLLKDGRTCEVKDTDLVNPISCVLHCADDSKQLSEGIKFDNDVKTHQWKIREVRIVYTRKKKRKHCSFEDKAEKKEARAPNNNSECAGLSYVDSQEPEDLYKALFFVDKYVSINASDSSPVADVSLKDKSPPLLTGKRVQGLVRLAKLRDRAQEIGIFEWDDSHHTDKHSDYMGKRGQLSSNGNKYGKTYVRKSPNLKDLLPKEHENPGIVLKEKTGSFNINEPLKDLSHLDANLAVCHSNMAGEIKQADEKKARDDFDTELDLTANRDCTVKQFENGAVHEESEHIFDVGIDTQIAAEAMEALFFASPADCSNIVADHCRKPLGVTQKTDHPGVWSFPKKTRSASRAVKNMCSDKQKDRMQISELNWRKKGEKLNNECLDENRFENSGKTKFIKKANTKGAKGLNTNGFKENKNSAVSQEDMSLCKLKRGRKQRDVPLAGNLNLSSLLNINEGLMNESMERKSNHHMKVGLPDKRKETSSTLEISAEMETHSKRICKKNRNSGMMKVRKDNKTCIGINESAVNTSSDKDKVGSTSLNTLNLKVSSSMESFCKGPSSKLDDTGSPKSIQEDELSGFTNGKQTSSSMLSHPGRSFGLEYSSVETRTKQSNHCPSKSQFKSESLLNSSSPGSNTKRKRRSSVCVSPYSVSSKVDCRRIPLLHSGGEPRQNEDHNNDSAVKKKRTNAQQLSKSGVTVAQSESFISFMDGARTDDGGVKLNVSNHVMSPNCPPLSAETNKINVINDHYEQTGKKRVISQTFSRELVRLGFNESIPGLVSKESRRRKTMANIRVLLSQNLDKGIMKHQKKILTRLGVPMVFCPSDATHFIADKFARTRNMLESIAQGIPVVTHTWLESCEQTGFYIDEKTYILRDLKKEQELGFKMPLSLGLARKHPLLEGFKVSITPNAQPGLDLLTSLVKAAQGQAVELNKDCTKLTLDNLLILSCEEDQDYCVPFLERGVAAYSSELILSGIIIQKLEFERHQLFAKHVKGH